LAGFASAHSVGYVGFVVWAREKPVLVLIGSAKIAATNLSFENLAHTHEMGRPYGVSSTAIAQLFLAFVSVSALRQMHRCASWKFAWNTPSFLHSPQLVFFIFIPSAYS
jgi:hypothetical protein